MARTARRKLEDIKSLTLEYDLRDLPTTQHKAGLAGLFLLVEALRELRRPGLPDMEVLSPTQVRLTLTPESLQVLMDDLYGAERVKVKSAAKWPGKEPLGEEEELVTDPKTSKAKRVKKFIYEQVQPKGEFFKAGCLGNLADKPRWMKLWREVIWGAVRGIPKTRGPYENRADGGPAHKCGIDKLWGKLVREHLAVQGPQPYSMNVASSLWLGAQEFNAELVPFQDRPSNTLLLHFWVVVMRCFVPEVLDKEGAIHYTDGHMLVALPEVSDLQVFQDDLRHGNAALSEQGGLRPADATVCMPEEGALAYQQSLASRAQRKTQQALCASISGVQVFYLEKRNKRVKTKSTCRVAPDRELLEHFAAIDRRMHPLLRAMLIRNLLQNAPWYHGFSHMAAVTDYKLLVAEKGCSRGTSLFCRHVQQQFNQSIDNA